MTKERRTGRLGVTIVPWFGREGARKAFVRLSHFMGAKFGDAADAWAQLGFLSDQDQEG